MWENPAMASVNHQPCGVRIVNRNFRRSLPHAIIAPTGEASAGVAPVDRVGGAPARITRKTALTRRRLSRAPPPQLPSRPGKWGSDFSRIESEISRRLWTAMGMCFSLAVKDKRTMPQNKTPDNLVTTHCLVSPVGEVKEIPAKNRFFCKNFLRGTGRG